MGIFSRRNKVVDLTEDYRPQRKTRITESSKISPSQNEGSSGGSFFDWFGNSNSSSNSTPKTAGEIGNISHGNFDPETGKPLNIDPDEKKKRLAIRLKNMTDRIEDLSNQVYNLQQKTDLLEKKLNTRKYE